MLQNRIDLAESKHNVKTNGVTITLIKAKKDETWSDLKPKQTLIKKDEKKTDKKLEEDPMSGLMGMMKDMYTNGDDNVKRMINESWTKSQDEKDKGIKSKTDPGDIADLVKNMKQ